MEAKVLPVVKYLVGKGASLARRSGYGLNALQSAKCKICEFLAFWWRSSLEGEMVAVMVMKS